MASTTTSSSSVSSRWMGSARTGCWGPAAIAPGKGGAEPRQAGRLERRDRLAARPVDPALGAIEVAVEPPAVVDRQAADGQALELGHLVLDQERGAVMGAARGRRPAC